MSHVALITYCPVLEAVFICLIPNTWLVSSSKPSMYHQK